MFPAMNASTTEPSKRGNPMAIISLVLAILALLLSLPVFPLALVLGLAAVILGVMARRRVKRGESDSGDGAALAGIIVGAIALLIAVVITVGFGILLSDDDTQKEIQQQEQQQ